MKAVDVFQDVLREMDEERVALVKKVVKSEEKKVRSAEKVLAKLQKDLDEVIEKSIDDVYFDNYGNKTCEDFARQGTVTWN